MKNLPHRDVYRWKMLKKPFHSLSKVLILLLKDQKLLNTEYSVSSVSANSVNLQWEAIHCQYQDR